MAKEITVKQLFNLCLEQITNGHGDKRILISADDEGNGFHGLFYGFTTKKEEIEHLQQIGLLHDDVDVDKMIILG